ncbi:winged helix DNA-binding protein [Bartonella sp. LJL80]
MKTIGPVVSSAHLAEGAIPALSELEYALTVYHNGFYRWMVHCMNAAGVSGLQAIDVQILHTVNHRGREKSMAELALLFNIEDTHIISYASKKLEGLGLIKTSRRGKEKILGITEKGAEACQRYFKVREQILIKPLHDMKWDEQNISNIASFIHTLSGHYDQATRTAVSL